ncbi:MAG TPA: SGNH/GDSL hydrolase family protein [Gemmatimonadales bacterium]|nr:SGNH/GDSL hydrolase family protein [Gemmatimonadales bacterium]
MSTAGHVVLLGDSIFDNAAYTEGGPDVVTQLRGLLPRGWSATLAAVDGAVVSSLAGQLARIPADATHLVVSAGGNDALGHIGLLERDARTVGEGLSLLAAAAEGFATEYRAAVHLLRRRGLPLTLCTIYEGSFPDPTFQRVAAASVALFDDAILRTAAAASLPVIELRLVCRAAEDYANPIEPSSVGGAKIARAIVHALGLSAGTAPSTTFVD